MVAGVFEIVLGCFCSLARRDDGRPVDGGSATCNSPPFHGPSFPALLLSVVIYLLAAIVFVWVGIGLARARRWAWALTVAWSWLWLVLGAVAVVAISSDGTRDLGRRRGARQIAACGGHFHADREYRGLRLLVRRGAGHLAGPVSPQVGPRDVRAARCPRLRWTDRCPLPVLALSLVFAFSSPFDRFQWPPTGGRFRSSAVTFPG